MHNIKEKDLKSFGHIWAGIFGFIAFIPLFKGQDLRIWAIVISLIFLAISILKPQFLQQFYKIWTAFGTFMGGMVSKFMLFILFYAFFTPIALLLRMLKKDALHKNIDKNKKSYWIERDVQPESMKYQF